MFWEMLVTGRLHVHLFLSLQRALLGFTIASLAGLPLGFLLGGWFKRFEEHLNPLLNILSQVNPFSVFPVFVLLFGIGEAAKAAIIFWVCVWPILFGTITGVKKHRSCPGEGRRRHGHEQGGALPENRAARRGAVITIALLGLFITWVISFRIVRHRRYPQVSKFHRP
jgi:hypothetical protein